MEGSLKDFLEFLGIFEGSLKDFLGFLGIFWDFWGFSRIFEGSLQYLVMTWMSTVNDVVTIVCRIVQDRGGAEVSGFAIPAAGGSGCPHRRLFIRFTRDDDQRRLHSHRRNGKVILISDFQHILGFLGISWDSRG